MHTENPRIDKTDLIDLIRQGYDLDLETLEFVPVGECSYDYLGKTGQGENLWIKVLARQGAARILKTLNAEVPHLTTSGVLRDRFGIGEVVAPLRTRNGGYALWHLEGPIAIFPYIEGEWLSPGSRTEEDVKAAGRLMGRVHSCNPDELTGMERAEMSIELFNIRYSGELRSLLDNARQEDTASDEDPTVRRLLRQHADEILEALEHLESLRSGPGVLYRRLLDFWLSGESLERAERIAGVELVVTHGDPNHANILKAQDSSLHLIDWDDVALAPPERDLVFFSGDEFGPFMHGYAEVRQPPRLRAELLAFYLYHWDLQEIADYGSRLLRGGLDEDERERCRAELFQYFPIRHEEIRATVKDMLRSAGQ